MSAVWGAARAAVRRRRLQTLVIGFVVLCSTATLVVALGLLVATSGPFDRAFAAQRGAHEVAVFDAAKVSAARLAATAHRPGVTAAAGPYGEAVVPVAAKAAVLSPGPMSVVGRSGPGGPVDRVNLWAGRWATRPGEIVLNLTPASEQRPADLHPIAVTGGPTLTVVGLAYSISGTADAWVTPGQLAALHPTGWQVLYRFGRAATASDVRAGLASATAGLPRGALTASQSYLTVKQDATAGAAVYVPFLLAFGLVGLVVAVLIVANVISGAVVSGYRHIGILKAMGFTPRQVVAVYLVMVSVPAAAGCLVGVVAGDLLTVPLLARAVRVIAPDWGGVNPWVDLACLLGMPAVVLLAALVPALRAHRLPAARAISAGSASRRGRAPRVQRALAGTRLPRPVSLGLGLPLARPGRTALTMAAIVLGVATVTLATGLSASLSRYGSAVERNDAVQVEVDAPIGGADGTSKLGDAAIESLLRAGPGARYVTAAADVTTHLVGSTQQVTAEFVRGDSAHAGHVLVHGRWLRPGTAEAVVTSAFAHQRGLRVGDALTVDTGGARARLTIAGIAMNGPPFLLYADWSALPAVAPGTRAERYEVGLRPGASVTRYTGSVSRADPQLAVVVKSSVNAGAVTVIGSSTLLTVLLGVVAALGVFNTVTLNARERRRDLGMLKSIGMTPRQLVAMMVTSMAALGLLGGLLGLPLGLLVHRVTVPAMAASGQVDLPPSMVDVWWPPELALLVLAGVAIAVLGAYLPSRAAARLTIATVLHNE